MTKRKHQLREGFRYCGIMYGYIPVDAESCSHAALIVWLNPNHNPGKPTTLQEAYDKEQDIEL